MSSLMEDDDCTVTAQCDVSMRSNESGCEAGAVHGSQHNSKHVQTSEPMHRDTFVFSHCFQHVLENVPFVRAGKKQTGRH